MLRFFWLLMVLGFSAKAQVALPYTTSFESGTQAVDKQLWYGPWDVNLRCDGLDSLRFGPSCCAQGQHVPWMGFAPNNYSCTPIPSDSGLSYLRIVKNYQLPGVLLGVWANPIIASPAFTDTTLAVLKLRAAKNTMQMAHLTSPWGNWSSHGNSVSYTALEIGLEHLSSGSLTIIDTFILGNNWSPFAIDAQQLGPLSPALYRFQIKLIGDGDASIDWAQLAESPIFNASITPSCTDSAPNGSIVLGGLATFTAPISAVWDHGASGTSITGLSPGRYFITITDALGKIARRHYDVPASVTITVDSILSIGTSPGAAWLSAQGTGSITWSWTGPGSFQSSTASPLFTVPGTYMVTATDSLGCYSTRPIVISAGCGGIPAPTPWSDSVCVGVVPSISSIQSPVPSWRLSYWMQAGDTALSNALSPNAAWGTANLGWNIRYARWVDTLQLCVGPSVACSLWVATAPISPASIAIQRCPQPNGYTFAWPATIGNLKLQWQTTSGGVWNTGVPSLTGSQTNTPGSVHNFSVRHHDSLTGCISPTAIGTYTVKGIFTAQLTGPSIYQYGLLHSVTSSGLGSGTKFWTVSNGGRFEMADPNHPCHNQTNCATSAAGLIVRGTVIPCWSPPLVTVAVSQAPIATACDSLSTLSAQTSASYECFSTEIASSQAVAWASPGDSIFATVSTQPNSFSIPGNPLSMSYASSCAFSIPHEWQVRTASGGPWTAWALAFPGTPYATLTDTNAIIFSLPAADPLLNGYELRLALERCQGVWDYSSAIPFRINLSLSEPSPTLVRVWPNPSSGVITIWSPPEALGTRWSLWSIEGHLVRSWTSSLEAIELSINPGVYFVHSPDAESQPQRIVVLH